MNTSSSYSIRHYTVLFLILAIVFYLVTDMAWFELVRQPILGFFAMVSAMILNVLGYSTGAQQDVISSSEFTVSIKEGCDALAPIILYSVAVLAYPVDWSYRVRGLFIGLITLIVLNIIRIVSLFVIGVHLPSWFDFMHVDFWQVLFIVLTAILWIIWMRSATIPIDKLTHE